MKSRTSAAAFFLCRLFRAKKITVVVRKATTLYGVNIHTTLALYITNKVLVTTSNFEA
ncbi:hypothetical protein M433DRAFT_161031 [Acidomyces richmondensis BFW]|nr:hypothetical protein M433DRAFT_161031 [Acidomyces richmondensis BFW]